MLTRYILHTDFDSHVLSCDELRNWDEITCSYKRSDLEGVVRSFSSSFEFVNGAYDILFELYRKDGVNSNASIEVQTITNNWEWETRFTCPLDFTSIIWEAGVLTLNCIDNSLASIIKAKKSTKYELVVGKEITSFKSLSYDRMLMAENAIYEFTQGENISDSKDIVVTFSDDDLPWVGLISSEIAVNGMVYFSDDQESDKTGYLISAHKDVKVNFKWSCSFRSDLTYGGVNLNLIVKHPDSTQDVFPLSYLARTAKVKVEASSGSTLPPLEPNGIKYAVIDGTVWVEGFNSWEDTGKSEADYFNTCVSGSVELELKEKDIVQLVSKNATKFDIVRVRFTSSRFEFDWQARGGESIIPLIKPTEAARRLLNKMTEGKMKVGVSISDFDPRLSHTYLIAAESIRGLSSSKFYSSFSEFCEWMSTVFGYVYFIGPIGERKYKRVAGFKNRISNYYPLLPFCSDEIVPGQIYFDKRTQKFFCSDDNYYARWIKDNDYFGDDGFPRKDIVYQDANGDAWVYEDGMKIFDRNDVDYEDVTIGVHFVHRSELFGLNNCKERSIDNISELKYSIESSLIYSSVEIGYEKKDYQEINGREEFNFANTYTTGCTVSDKCLKMISKYRADCYGIEYAVRKSNKDSTDSTSDTDVFFVLCRELDENSLIVYPDRTNEVTGVSSDTVFNSAFSPMSCVEANAGYIGLQTKSMTLHFTSSTGNSNVTINGVPISSDIVLNCDLATCGVIEFATDDLSVPEDDELIMVTDDGVKYRGYLKEVDFNYAKEESARYKLIVKNIE